MSHFFLATIFPQRHEAGIEFPYLLI